MTEDDQQALEILTTLDVTERQIWLETGRRLLSGEVRPDDAMAWATRELARLKAAPPVGLTSARGGREAAPCFAFLLRCEYETARCETARLEARKPQPGLITIAVRSDR